MTVPVSSRQILSLEHYLVDHAALQASPSSLWRTTPHAGRHRVDMAYYFRGDPIHLGFYQLLA
jgi:hypothetical protein